MRKIYHDKLIPNNWHNDIGVVDIKNNKTYYIDPQMYSSSDMAKGIYGLFSCFSRATFLTMVDDHTSAIGRIKYCNNKAFGFEHYIKHAIDVGARNFTIPMFFEDLPLINVYNGVMVTVSDDLLLIGVCKELVGKKWLLLNIDDRTDFDAEDIQNLDMFCQVVINVSKSKPSSKKHVSFDKVFDFYRKCVKLDIPCFITRLGSEIATECNIKHEFKNKIIPEIGIGKGKGRCSYETIEPKKIFNDNGDYYLNKLSGDGSDIKEWPTSVIQQKLIWSRKRVKEVL